MQRRNGQSAASGTPGDTNGGMVHTMTLATDSEVTGQGFTVEDITTGVHASGFGQLGDGRSFSFYIDHADRHVALVVEVYRPRLRGPVPQAEDIVATASRRLTDIDMTDERSIIATVRDAIADAQPVARNGR